MKAVDYINTLIKEKEELKALCKSHVETIRLIKRELSKLNIAITKKDKKIQELENDANNLKSRNELNSVKNELGHLKAEYDVLLQKYNEVVQENVNLEENLKNPKTKSTSKTRKGNDKAKEELKKLKLEYDALLKKYNDVVSENDEYKQILDEIENICDSEQ